MLVLSRKLNESIMIGGDIEIVVLATEGDTVKLGITAPKEVSIFRKELYETIQESNRAAASTAVPFKSLTELVKKKQNE